MAIIVAQGLAEKGPRDARRHREKQKDVIKKQLPEIIAEEAIITSDRKGKKVKIPIRRLDIPHFRSGRKNGGGVGQGQGEKGDVIGRKKPGGKGKPGSVGQEPGEDFIETEVDIEEIIEMMLEDLGLPRLQKKEAREIAVELGFKIKGRQKSGPWVLLDRKTTVKDGLKKFWILLKHLQRETGLDELTCFSALKKANGILSDALDLLELPGFKADRATVKPFAILRQDDLTFRKIVDDREFQSNAVMIAMMDVSGSMTTFKKYLARSMLFWLVEFLRKLYHRVEIRFIIHHAEAKLVDEETFFKTGESGGTRCFTAYELASQLVDAEYPVDRWNVYGFHFSDGDDWDPAATVKAVSGFISRGVNMLGYGEIAPDEESHFNTGERALFRQFIDQFHLERYQKDKESVEIAVGGNNLPFLGLRIGNKTHILPAIKEFLKKDRWVANE